MTSINPTTIALAEKYAQEHFKLSLPITAEELKSAFRREAKVLHTDTSGDASTKDTFIAMKAAYDFLAQLEGMEYVYGEPGSQQPNSKMATTDGTPLYELGLGLGAMKNGRDCERCERKGYIVHQGYSRPMYNRPCKGCDGQRWVARMVPCHPCKGTGKFQQARSQRIVDCRVCKGSGEIPHHDTLCQDCHGAGYEMGASTYDYVKCYQCNGTGEIEVYNPLLPKGRIINKVRSR